MKILVVGNGGREHAIGWRLSVDERGNHALFFAPGNPGTAQLGENVNLQVTDIEGICRFVEEAGVELTIVGPELPLSLGLVDLLKKHNHKVFGPTQAAARIESSKNFAKEIMLAAGVPTAQYKFCHSQDEALRALLGFSSPYVLKADGLAAGKGVVVTPDREVAEGVIAEHFFEGDQEGLLVEEYLEGKEASLIVMTDGRRIVPLPLANDYKRIFDGDQGPNTGGMGTVSPTPHLACDRTDAAIDTVIRPVLEELNRRGAPFQGFLYAGLMVAPDGGLKVIEFNARMGDPEAQVLMRRFNGNLGETIAALSGFENQLPSPLPPHSHTAVCVVLASHGYPESSRNGDIIRGIHQAEGLGGVVVFHAGTKVHEDTLVTNGGRVLGVTGIGDTASEARLRVYDAIRRIDFDGMQYRKDIAEFSKV